MKKPNVVKERSVTVIVACLVVSSMLIASVGPVAAGGDSSSKTVETLKNGEDLYLVFGADLGNMTLEGYIEAHADENPSGETNGEVIQYKNVGQVDIHEQGEAVSVAIGDGAEATAIQEVNQQSANSQDGETTVGNYLGTSQKTTFEKVDDVYMVMGESPDKQFDGWGTVEGDEATDTQTAEATVSQAQQVRQANINQNVTALAYAENGSSATAVQVTQQSNVNLQEGSANATNILATDLDEDMDLKEKHKKSNDALRAQQTANATIQQSQEIQQVNVYEQGAAVAIAVGENASATAIQVTDQLNLNEQLGTAEAINVMMESAGMNVATASIDGTTDVVTQEGADYPTKDKKGDKDHDNEVDQTAEATVTQYQSVEQVNINLNSSAEAIATEGSEAKAVQLTFQQNINAQIASADVLNVFLEENDEFSDKERKKLDAKHGNGHEGVVLTNKTTVTINGDNVDDANLTSFDYDGSNNQLNNADQYSTAGIEQSQNLTQLNRNSFNALAVADSDGNAFALQVSIQENENLQTATNSEVTVSEAPVDDKKTHDDESADSNNQVDNSETTITKASQDTSDDSEKTESQPGFGVAVGLSALLVAAIVGLREWN